MADIVKSTKTLADHFRDWEHNTFGFGYGTGEDYIIPALRKFLVLCQKGLLASPYDYRTLEEQLTPTVTWLLINVLAQADILEYGTSPRFGWLTDKGERLREFMLARTDEQLIDITTKHSEAPEVCYPDACNCGPNGYEEGRKCPNPFWG